jgi:hypothetical protein
MSDTHQLQRHTFVGYIGPLYDDAWTVKTPNGPAHITA